jgi:hypothetical protein
MGVFVATDCSDPFVVDTNTASLNAFVEAIADEVNLDAPTNELVALFATAVEMQRYMKMSRYLGVDGIYRTLLAVEGQPQDTAFVCHTLTIVGFHPQRKFG